MDSHATAGDADQTGHHIIETTTVPIDPAYRLLRAVLRAVRTELECIDAPACRYDVIVSQSPTQRGADLKGDGTQGRVWVREVQELPANTSFCPPMWMTVDIGVIRCHKPTGDDPIDLPPVDWYERETARVYADKQAVRAAVNRVNAESGRSSPRWYGRAAVMGWQPYGPQSFAVGSITTIRARRA